MPIKEKRLSDGLRGCAILNSLSISPLAVVRMAKLNEKKVKRIIQQMEKGEPVSRIASIQKVTRQWVNELHRRYKETGKIPALGKSALLGTCTPEFPIWRKGHIVRMDSSKSPAACAWTKRQSFFDRNRSASTRRLPEPGADDDHFPKIQVLFHIPERSINLVKADIILRTHGREDRAAIRSASRRWGEQRLPPPYKGADGVGVFAIVLDNPQNGAAEVVLVESRRRPSVVDSPVHAIERSAPSSSRGAKIDGFQDAQAAILLDVPDECLSRNLVYLEGPRPILINGCP
jgi:hypothetical protein